MTVDTINIFTASKASLAEIVRLYKDHISADLARLLRLTGFGALEERGEGCWVFDEAGNRYLDFSGGYGVLSLGHRHPRVVAAVKDQLDHLALSSKVFLNPLQAKLAKRLADITPGNLAISFFCNSGTEAIEAALKVARLATGRTGFVSTENSFHGKTFGGLSISGRKTYKEPFAPLLPNCHVIPFGDGKALDERLDDSIAAFIVEPIQGEGGIHVASSDYLKLARKLCSERGILFIVDEIQSGLCRSGKWFAIEHAEVVPDIITLAKALGGGVMPIGAMVTTKEVAKAYRGRPLLHTSTFGGNPLACRAALASLEVMEEENLCTKAWEKGKILIAKLAEVAQEYQDLIADVRGVGLLAGVEFKEDKYGGSVIFEMVKQKVIAVYTLNQPKVLRFEPSLLVEAQEIELAVKALRCALENTRDRFRKEEI